MDRKPVISRLDIGCYRGINDLTLDNLSRVNILTGANNVGKTSVLEAIHSLGLWGDLPVLLFITYFRFGSLSKNMLDHITDYLLTLFQKENGAERYRFSLGMDILGKRYSCKAEGVVSDSIRAPLPTRNTPQNSSKIWSWAVPGKPRPISAPILIQFSKRFSLPDTYPQPFFHLNVWNKWDSERK